MNISIGDFTKLNISVQGILAALIIFMPLWFITIYLGATTFFNSHPLYLIIIFCYCLSIVFLFSCMILSLMILVLLTQEDKIKNIETIGFGVEIGLMVMIMSHLFYFLSGEKLALRQYITDIFAIALIVGIPLTILVIIKFIKLKKKKNKQLELKFPEDN
ncbi:MAG: hypothetical protein Q8K60_03415 [Parachlamydiaceae bacterium]|nr:hypothetical protein [Parachlamydiaceae bacterium]